MKAGGSVGGRRSLISHAHAWSWMVIPGKPSARLTHDLRLITGQRFLRFSILKETPTPLQDDKSDGDILSPKPWKLISSTKEASFRIFDLRTDRARSPRTDQVHDFYVLESTDWVNVIPITPGNQVVLIRQYRHGTREVTLEIPGGIVEPDDTPEKAARRELLEETGFREAQMVPLGIVHPNPAFLDNFCHTYLAKDVTRVKDQEQDEKEDIEVVLTPLEEIPRLIREREITHSLVVAAFYRFYMEYLPRLGGKT